MRWMTWRWRSVSAMPYQLWYAGNPVPSGPPRFSPALMRLSTFLRCRLAGSYTRSLIRST